MKIQRFYLHIRRFRDSIVHILWFSMIATLLFISFYTAMGEEAVRTMFGIIVDSPYIAGIPGIGSGSTAWTLWMVFYLRIFLFYTFAVFGINLGARILPTTTEDGVELLLGTNPVPAPRYYLENVITSNLLMVVTFIPMYFVIVIATLVYSTADILANITQVFVATWTVGIFHMAMVSLISVLTFSKAKARIAGIVYLAFSFIIETLAESPDYSDLANLSVNAYVKPMGPIAPGFNWNPVWVLTSTSILVFALSAGLIRNQSYLEQETQKRKWKNPLTGIISNRVAPDSLLGKRYPLFTDQLRNDSGFLVGVIIFILFQQFALYNALPSVETLAEVLAQSTSPMLSAFSQNHPLQESMLGFIVLKFYSSLWIFYGIFIVIIAGSIPNRDVNTDTHDLLFANDIPMRKLIVNRVLALLLGLTIIIWISFFAIRVLQAGKVELEFMTQFGVFLVMWVHYMGLAILLTGVAMIPKISQGKKLSVIVFIFFVTFSFIPFLNESIEFLKYLSYLSYFDPVGMVYEVTPFLPQFLTSVLLSVISCVFTWKMINKRYINADLR